MGISRQLRSGVARHDARARARARGIRRAAERLPSADRAGRLQSIPIRNALGAISSARMPALQGDTVAYVPLSDRCSSRRRTASGQVRRSTPVQPRPDARAARAADAAHAGEPRRVRGDDEPPRGARRDHRYAERSVLGALGAGTCARAEHRRRAATAPRGGRRTPPPQARRLRARGRDDRFRAERRAATHHRSTPSQLAALAAFAGRTQTRDAVPGRERVRSSAAMCVPSAKRRRWPRC